MILFTSDVHCGIDQNFGFAGLQRVREYLESEGNSVILVDNGDQIQGEPIEPEKTYTLAGRDFMLTQYGGGFTMFKGDKVLQDSVKVDTQVMSDYINESLGGTVGAEYEDPYGQGRITIIEKPE